MPSRDLRVRLIGQDDTSGAFGSAGKNASAMTKVFAAAAAAAGAAVGVFVAKGVKDAAELDSKLREINTLFGLTGQAGQQNFSDISRVVRDVSNNVGVAQKTIAEGLYNAISAGVPKENAFTFMQVASKAAIAGVTDVNTAVNGMTTVINAFGLQAADAASVADSMFTAVRGGKTTFRELSDALFNVAPAAAASKVSFREVNAAIATLTASGTPTSVATTQIRAALTGLQRPSKDLDGIFQKLGYTNAQTAIESKGLGFALDAVRTASGGNNGALQNLLGSVEAVSAANVLAGTGAAKFRAELDAQAGSAGATDKAFAEMEQSVGRQFERLIVIVQNLGIEVGSRLLPVVTAAFAAISDFVTSRVLPAFDRLSLWWTTNSPAILAAIDAVVSFLRDNLAPILGAVATVGLAALGSGFASAAAAIAAFLSPAVLVVGALAAVAAGLVYAYQHSETFRDIVSAAFEKVQAVVRASMDFVTRTVVPGIARIVSDARPFLTDLGAAFRNVFDFIRGVVTVFVTVVSAAWNAFGGTLVSFIRATFDNIRQVIGGALDIIKGIVNVFVGVLSGDWSRAWDGIKGVVIGAWEVIKGVVGVAFAAVKGLFSLGLDALQAQWSLAWSAIRTVVQTAWSLITTVVQSAVSAVVGFIAALPSRAVGALASFGAGIVGVARAAWAAFSGAVDAGVADVLGALRALPGQVVSALGSLGGLLVNAGRALMEGLARGIAERIAQVVQKVRDAVGLIGRLLPGSPIKDGPLTSWNNGGAGRRLMGMLAGGIESGTPGVRSALVDALDVGGMSVGGAGFVNARMAATAGSAPADIVRPSSDRSDELIALLMEQNELLRRMPRDYMLAQRQG